jgi:hypothetical protein
MSYLGALALDMSFSSPIPFFCGKFQSLGFMCVALVLNLLRSSGDGGPRTLLILWI